MKVLRHKKLFNIEITSQYKNNIIIALKDIINGKVNKINYFLGNF
jgi:hypothetical protein